MIYIKRSVDFYKDVTWVAADLDWAQRRTRGLYTGNDVNGAIAAAVAAGMPEDEAQRQAEAEIKRCKEQVNDTIAVALPH